MGPALPPQPIFCRLSSFFVSSTLFPNLSCCQVCDLLITDKLSSMFQELVEHSGFTGQFVLLELFLHSSLYQKPKGRVLKRYRKCFKTELFGIRYSVGFNFTKVSKDRLLYLKINHSFNCRNHSLWDLCSQCTSQCQWTPINSITTDSRKLVLIV